MQLLSSLERIASQHQGTAAELAAAVALPGPGGLEPAAQLPSNPPSAANLMSNASAVNKDRVSLSSLSGMGLFSETGLMLGNEPLHDSLGAQTLSEVLKITATGEPQQPLGPEPGAVAGREGVPPDA